MRNVNTHTRRSSPVMYCSTNLEFEDPEDGPGRPGTSFSAFVIWTQHSSASRWQCGYMRTSNGRYAHPVVRRVRPSAVSAPSPATVPQIVETRAEVLQGRSGVSRSQWSLTFHCIGHEERLEGQLSEWNFEGRM